MSRTPPPNLRSLEARIRNLAREQELPEGRVRRLIGIVVVGQVLAQTKAAAVKGASSLEIRVGTRSARVSSDLDMLRHHRLRSFATSLPRRCATGGMGSLAHSSMLERSRHRYRTDIVRIAFG